MTDVNKPSPLSQLKRALDFLQATNPFGILDLPIIYDDILIKKRHKMYSNTTPTPANQLSKEIAELHAEVTNKQFELQGKLARLTVLSMSKTVAGRLDHLKDTGFKAENFEIKIKIEDDTALDNYLQKLLQSDEEMQKKYMDFKRNLIGAIHGRAKYYTSQIEPKT